MAFDKKLLEVLACPVCKGKLVLNEDMTQFDCMLPLPEKKWLFEKMLEQHGSSIYPNQS